MLFRREGFPEESEIVVCTVTKVQYHSVFVSLNEYGGKSAMLHISEVSPGRIRNLNDYVKEGKVIICKVLRLDRNKGHIDVSLRRVNEGQRKTKNDVIKQEQKAEKIIEFVAKQLKLEFRKLYFEIFKKVTIDYEYLHQAFNSYVNDGYDLASLDLNENLFKTLDETIRQRIKPPEVEIKADIKLESYASDGLIVVRDLLNSIVELDPETVAVHYLGGGLYGLNMKGEEYKTVEEKYSKIEEMLEGLDPKECVSSITRK